MLILVDSGSSQVHIGWWDRGRIVRAESYPYPSSTGDLLPFVTSAIAHQQCDGAAACSVSATWREPLFEALAELFPDSLRIARTAADIGVRVPYAKPETYGIDRALAVHAAFERFHDSCVVADAGTALTVDAVAQDGSVAGGFIMPGAALQASSLAMVTALPLVAMDTSEALLGTSTDACIGLGVRYGYLAAIHDLVDRSVQAVKAGERVLLTGGCSQLLSIGLKRPHEVEPNLVLEGLGQVYDRLVSFT